jgi:mannitol-1-phosphate 5-dehydrogenase
MNKIVIWGAGKIGRGFIADLFYQGGYEIAFIDSDRKLTDILNRKRNYSVITIPANDNHKTLQVKNFKAYHTSEKETIRELLCHASLLAIATFPDAYDSISETLSEVIEKRAESENPLPVDILVCANILNPSSRLMKLLMNRLSDRGQEYLNEMVGLVDTLIIRIAIEADEQQKSTDPLAVITNGYPELPLDKTAFKGELPDIKGLVYTKRIIAEEIRKIYTYNLVHAVFAYAGARKNYLYVTESSSDPEILRLAKNTLSEVSEGLQKAFEFSTGEMSEWNEKVLVHMTNPALQDTLTRIGADPVRKLGREDRLLGPALMCRNNGILPYYLSKIIAYAFLFDQPGDKGCQEIKEYIRVHGIKETIANYCGLEREKDLVWLIARLYKQIKNNEEHKDQPERITFMKKAFGLGFRYEQNYHGCAQCTLGALYELTGKREGMIFKASTAFSGGMAISGDGPCGGYSGGILFMGTYVGRRLDKIDNDKDNQYKAYDMAMVLRDRFIETYGSIICKDIHNKIFGRSYILRTKAVRDEFEEAGGHLDKCPAVVGISVMWIAEILMDENYI